MSASAPKPARVNARARALGSSQPGCKSWQPCQATSGRPRSFTLPSKNRERWMAGWRLRKSIISLQNRSRSPCFSAAIASQTN